MRSWGLERLSKPHGFPAFPLVPVQILLPFASGITLKFPFPPHFHRQLCLLTPQEWRGYQMRLPWVCSLSLHPHHSYHLPFKAAPCPLGAVIPQLSPLHRICFLSLSLRAPSARTHNSGEYFRSQTINHCLSINSLIWVVTNDIIHFPTIVIS